MKITTIAKIILIVLVSDCVYGQTKGFKTYKNPQHSFSFDIRSTWKITQEEDTTNSDFIATCRPTAKDEIATYKSCFDGIIFYIMYFNSDLEKTLQNQGYEKRDNVYY